MPETEPEEIHFNDLTEDLQAEVLQHFRNALLAAAADVVEAIYEA